MDNVKLTHRFRSGVFPFLIKLGCYYTILEGVALLGGFLVLSDNLSNLFTQGATFRFQCITFLLSLFLAGIHSLIATVLQKRKNKTTRYHMTGFLGFLQKTGLCASSLLILLSLVAYFYQDAYSNLSASSITNIYAIGISFQLYLAILLFSVVFSLLTALFNIKLLHPMLKLFLHFLGTMVSVAIIDLLWLKGMETTSAKIWALIIASCLYSLFGACYLLWDRIHMKAEDNEEYQSLYHDIQE